MRVRVHLDGNVDEVQLSLVEMWEETEQELVG